MRIHVLDSTRFADTDDLFTEVLSRIEQAPINLLVLVEPKLDCESLIGKLRDLGILTRLIVGDQTSPFCKRPSIIDLMLGSQGISSYEIWVNDQEPQELVIDQEFLNLLDRLKASATHGRTDIQKHLLSDLSRFFQKPHESMDVSVRFFESQYNVLDQLLEEIFRSNGIASSNELRGLVRNSKDMTPLYEFSFIVNQCNRRLPTLKAHSPTVALKLEEIKRAYSMAYDAHGNEGEWLDPNRAASCLIWIAAFLAIYAQGRLAEHQSFSAFLATFRTLELISHALLLKTELIEFRRHRNNMVLALAEDGSRLTAFGTAWELCRRKLKQRNTCTENQLELLDEIIEFRNNLLLVHGLRYVNKQLAHKYLEAVLRYAIDVESKVDRSLKFGPKFALFKSVHCYDVAAMAIESVKESLSIQGPFEVAIESRSDI